MHINVYIQIYILIYIYIHIHIHIYIYIYIYIYYTCIYLFQHTIALQQILCVLMHQPQFVLQPTHLALRWATRPN